MLGEPVGSVRFPASASGERILDAITRTGNLKSPGHDLWVMLERHGHREIVPFGALIYEPANNIYVRPQDTIFIYSEPQTFLAFGATGSQAASAGGNNRQFTFGAWRISLAEALAKSGGLADLQADPASVFLYRGETRELAELLRNRLPAISWTNHSSYLQCQFARSGRLFLGHKVPNEEQGCYLCCQCNFSRLY